MPDHGVQRAVRVVRRAAVRQAREALAERLLPDRLDQTRFSDSRLARDQHHLAQSLLALLPTPEEEADLLVAAYQGRAADRPAVPVNGPGVNRPDDPDDLHGLGNSSERRGSEIVNNEGRTGQPGGGGAGHHGVGLGQPLDASGDVRGLAQGELLVTVAAADGAHDDRPRVDPHPDREPHPPLSHRGALVLRAARSPRRYRAPPAPPAARRPRGPSGSRSRPACRHRDTGRWIRRVAGRPRRPCLLICPDNLAEGLRGPSRPERSVEPTRSQNMTVSCRRSASGALRDGTGAAPGSGRSVNVPTGVLMAPRSPGRAGRGSARPGSPVQTRTRPSSSAATPLARISSARRSSRRASSSPNSHWRPR